MKTPDTTEVMPSALDSVNFTDSSSVDQYSEIVLDLGELIDAARDCIRNAGLGSVDELLEALRVDHIRSGRSSESWQCLRPLARDAATKAFNDALASGELLPSSRAYGWPKPKPLGIDEVQNARATPDCIVEDYLYADVALIPAPGGYGKTTLMLYEAACIAYGSPTLHGRRVIKPGPVVIITAEDSREQMAARLREVILENGLLAMQSKIVQNIHINDVAGLGLKLTEVEKDVVVTSARVGDLIDALRAIKPVLVIIDPAVSFGVGESRVNDAEQGLIEAARKVRNEIGCCVRFVHHTGKQNARDAAVDQYAGRGGSAFADGARMVHVLAWVSNADWHTATGAELKPNETGLRLVFAKMSFCRKQPDVYLRRTGYRFEVVVATVLNATQN